MRLHYPRTCNLHENIWMLFKIILHKMLSNEEFSYSLLKMLKKNHRMRSRIITINQNGLLKLFAKQNYLL